MKNRNFFLSGLFALGLSVSLACTAFPAYAADASPGANECYLSPPSTESVDAQRYNCNVAPPPPPSSDPSAVTQKTPVTYSPTPITALTDSTIYWGARSDKGCASIPIDIGGICYYVDNLSETSYFIPFKTAAEWKAFATDSTLPSGITFTQCARPMTYTIQPGLNCHSPVPVSSSQVTLPYARYPNPNSQCTSNPYTASVSYTCTASPPNPVFPKWVETVTEKFIPPAQIDGSWTVIGTTYAGALQ